MEKFSIKKIIFLASFLILSGCTAIGPIGGEAAFKYLGFGKGAVDLASYSSTGKTINDHLFSAIIGKDCKIGRIITRKPICVEIDARSQKYNVYNQGKIISKNNIVRMKFPSQVYEFNKTLKQSLKKKLKKSNIKLVQ